MELGIKLFGKAMEVETLEEKTISSPWISGGSRQ
jgi:hypothetical protein